MSDRVYYLVGLKSPVLGVINEAEHKHMEYQKAVREFAKEFGSKKWMVSTNWVVRLIGLTFDGDPPIGWRLAKRHGCYVPALKSPEGRAIRNRMEALPSGVSASSFSAMMDKLENPKSRTYTVWVDNSICWTMFEKIGSRYVLNVPATCKVTPPGCKKLKTSEYWRMREKATT